MTMWTNLPFDLLSNIFSFLSPDSLARAKSACRLWHTCVNLHLSTEHHSIWFVALPLRNRSVFYAHNPILNIWHQIPMDFVPDPVRLIAPIGSLLLLRSTNSTILQLSICNPFTRQFMHLPKLNINRTNPAVGVVILGSNHNVQFPNFMIYVAGGMADAPQGGAMYEQTLEMYDSRSDTWQIVGSTPLEFSVRLTVWTPNESVYSNGVVYWMTSARAYSLMGFDICSNIWKEMHVPMADRLEFATLIQQTGRFALIGGTGGGEAGVWELDEGGSWRLVDKVPNELGLRFLENKGNWNSTKCVGNNGVVCLYRELGCGMVVGKEIGENGRREWFWVEGCHSIRGKKVQNVAIKGLLLHPTLVPF